MQTSNIAIIGAGLSGLVLAQQLATTHQVQLFEKSRGLGGRLATRYAEPYQFDHGAQSFRAQSTAFQAFILPLQQAGVIAPWEAEVVDIQSDGSITPNERQQLEYVGVPKMNQIGKYLAEGLSIQRQTRITQIQGSAKAWMLQTEDGAEHGPYDWVISTAPPAQTAAILPPGCLPSVHTAHMQGCYVLMLGFTEPLSIDWQIAHVDHPVIHNIALNQTKPGRPAGYSMVVHTTAAWAETHSEAANDWVQNQMIQLTSALIQQDLSQAAHTALHQWRYATNEPQVCPIDSIDTQNGVAACGDWCGLGRVEDAYQHALSIAEIIRNAG